ncbi:type IV pilus assembly PilZ [Shewanella denitrificans OS217]|uniref:Type IV pilus assembly PilZ n=1 Tax=Shewanella denitrificans (strain OS217 / ATCC BAA-1090 / DSM 15013) TaxID=318161 RepID=Q12I21_SHEDO|nr:PilZ domain-containing protein [Shewanella denitrificans]ABE56905.1 type IV pilus assembly PilZ [Shewanella denitrificans OS217]
MIVYEEFWHRDGSPISEGAFEEINLNDHDSRRQSQRINLRKNNEIPLNLACDGVSISLLRMGWLTLQPLGSANVKDISLTGIGFLSSQALAINDEVIVQFQGIKLSCQICRHQKVQGKLAFYGANWLEQGQENLRIAFINHIRLHVKR